MVRPWPPMTFRCKSCGWQTTTQGSSDAMRVGIDVLWNVPPVIAKLLIGAKLHGPRYSGRACDPSAKGVHCTTG